jgi:uncharacterized membrane protein YfcA
VLFAAPFAVAGLSAAKTVLLGLCGLVGGIGITALGPGGVLFTIGLFALSGLSPPAIAGTAIVANVGTGLLGTAAYARSGQLRGRDTRRLAGLLIACAVVGTPLGVLANSHISGPAFGTLLGVCVMAVGALLYARVRRPAGPARAGAGVAASTGAAVATSRVLVIGACVAVVSGLFGLGGPLLAVPLLVAAATPMLTALGAAQAQSVVIAGVGTLGYVLRGDVSWPLAALVGLPALVGVVAGWRLAHALPADRLRQALAGVLILVGAYLIVRNL